MARIRGARAWQRLRADGRTAGREVKPADLDQAFSIVCDHDEVEFPPGDAEPPDPGPAWQALERFSRPSARCSRIPSTTRRSAGSSRSPSISGLDSPWHARTGQERWPNSWRSVAASSPTKSGGVTVEQREPSRGAGRWSAGRVSPERRRSMAAIVARVRLSSRHDRAHGGQRQLRGRASARQHRQLHGPALGDGCALALESRCPSRDAAEVPLDSGRRVSGHGPDPGGSARAARRR